MTRDRRGLLDTHRWQRSNQFKEYKAAERSIQIQLQSLKVRCELSDITGASFPAEVLLGDFEIPNAKREV